MELEGDKRRHMCVRYFIGTELKSSLPDAKSSSFINGWKDIETCFATESGLFLQVTWWL